MARAPKRQKAQVRAPSKTMEREIIQRAERLAKDPGLALPVPVPPLVRDPFEGARRRMERISRFAGDQKRLKFYANWGDQLSRAYAGTLMLAAAGKVPILVNMKLPQGDVVPFAFRGRAKKEKLAGMQWYDHSLYRLLLFLDMAAKRPHFHFYSTPERLYCSGKMPGAPMEYVRFAMQHVKAGVKEVADGTWACPHLDPKAVKEGKAEEGTYLRIWWGSPRVAVGVCDRCARARPGSTIMALASHMAVPKLDDDFEVAVMYLPEGAMDCKECATIADVGVDEEAVSKYLKGELTDDKLISDHLADVEDRLREHGGTHYVLDGRCYGTDCESFVEALSPTEEEGIALKAVLPRIAKPLILDGTTPSKVLAEVWDEHGHVALDAVVNGDEELRDRYMQHPELAENPSKVLRKAMVEGRKRNIISRLPRYEHLPPIARFADAVTRTYMTEGQEGAVKTLERERVSDHKVKSLAYSFLLIFGKEANKEWQYDRTEKEFAQFLKDKVEALLEARPEAYHQALQRLLSATGSTERLPEPIPPEGGA